jgi:mRNA-degrading endonuclease RelE of RelBE toxin-antitoxin system
MILPCIFHGRCAHTSPRCRRIRKKRFNRALKNLSEGGGDTHPLVKNLSGYWRLRTGHHRVIYFYGVGMVIECVYAGDRATIYQTFVPFRIK